LSGNLESVIPAATPEGSPSQFVTWAEAAWMTASSPEPPLMAPVRRSDTNGQSAMTHGCPGFRRLTHVSAARHSASPWASDPASAAGEVAPACPADTILIGMSRLTWATMHRAASSAKRSGGTTNVLCPMRKGRSAKAPSRPSITSNMSTASSTCSGWKKELPTGLLVPMEMA